MNILTKIFLTLIFITSSMFSQTISNEALNNSAHTLTSDIDSVVIETIIEQGNDTTVSDSIDIEIKEDITAENIPDTTTESTEQLSISESSIDSKNSETNIVNQVKQITELNDASEDSINKLKIVECIPNCRKGFICVDGECLPSKSTLSVKSIEERTRLKYINKLGDLDRLFISTNIIYSIGSWYSAITPMIYSQKCWNRYNYYSKGYYDKFGIITYAPGSSVYITFGSMNLVQIAKSVSLLKEVNEKPNANLQIAGIALYSSAIISTTINITSVLQDNKTFTATTSLVNAALVISAYAVNTATYAVNRKRVKNSKVLRTTETNNNINVLPYVYSDGKNSGAGLALKF